MGIYRIGRIGALLLGLVVLGASCGAGSDGRTQTTQESNDPAASPIAELFGFDMNDEGFWYEQELQVQTSIAECMKSRGFEYEPFIPVEIADLDERSDPVAYARTHGFGISTGDDPWRRSSNSDVPVDPNEVRTASMSTRELAAYYEALNGPGPELDHERAIVVDPATGEEIDYLNREPRGCSGEAETERRERFAILDSFGAELSELANAVEADPRILAAVEHHETCVANAGYPDPSSEYNEISQSYVQLINDPRSTGSISASQEGSSDDGPPARSIPDELQDRMAEVQDREIAFAIADAECHEEANTEATWTDVYRTLEEEWVASHGQAVKDQLSDNP